MPEDKREKKGGKEVGMAACNKCGKPIKFFQNTSGKWIPVDMEPVFWRPADTSIGESNEDTIVFENRETTKGIVSYTTGCYDGYHHHLDTCKGRR